MFTKFKGLRRVSYTPTTLSTSSSNLSGGLTASSESTATSTVCSSHYGRGSTDIEYSQTQSVDMVDELYDLFSHDTGDDDDIQAFEFTEKQYRRRQALIQKLFDTESDYVNQLHAILLYFKRPLSLHFDASSRDNQHQQGSTPSHINSTHSNTLTSSLRPTFLSRQSTLLSSSTPHMSIHDIQILFSPIEKLYTLHEQFLNKLSQRFHIWGPLQLLADLIQLLVDDLVSFYNFYLENYPKMMAILEIIGKNRDTKNLLEVDIHNPGGIGHTHLFSLLELPLYAVHRYTILVTEITKLTTFNHPDIHQLKKVQDRLQEIENNVNPRIKICQNINQLVDMSLTVVGCPDIMGQPRQFIKSGKLGNVEGKTHDLRICFLLNDQLITTCPRPGDGMLHYKSTVSLKGATFKTVKRMDASFIIVEDSTDSYQYSEDIELLLNATGSAPPRQHHFKAESLDDMLSWLRDLQNTVQSLRQKQ